jgi:hypothetical protein
MWTTEHWSRLFSTTFVSPVKHFTTCSTLVVVIIIIIIIIIIIHHLGLVQYGKEWT